MILTEEEILQSWYSTTELMPSDGMIQQRVFARTIEQAILDKLQDKLKNADRYEWLKQRAFTGHRDGGYTKNYIFPHICYQDGYNGICYDSVDKAIDSAMKGNKL